MSSCRQFTQEAGKDRCSYLIHLRASKQLQYLLSVLSSSGKTGERMNSTGSLEILLNEASDKEDCMEDGVRGIVFIFLYIKLPRSP